MLSGDLVLLTSDACERVVITSGIVTNMTISTFIALVGSLRSPLALRADAWLSSRLRTIVT